MPTTSAERKIHHLDKYETIEKIISNDTSNSKSAINRQYTKLSKSLAVFSILKAEAKSEEAAAIAKDICKTAKKYSFPKFIIEPAEFLFRYYVQKDFNRGKALKMKSLSTSSLELYQKELSVSRNFSELMLCERSKHHKKHVASRAYIFWIEIQEDLNKIKSFDFHKVGFLIGAIYFRTTMQWNKLEELSKLAIQYFKTFPLRSEPILAIYYRNLINSLLIQGKDDEIENLLDQYKVLVGKSPLSWINYQYTLAKIKTIRLELEEIPSIVNSVKKVRGYKSIAKMNQLAWEILLSYVKYCQYNIKKHTNKLVLSNYVEKAKEEDMLTEHYKLQLLIIRLIYYIHNKEWRLVDSNSAAISKYLNRKLVRQGQSRSYYFIKMLLQLPERQYHSIAIKRHTNNYIKKLKANPSNAIGSEQDYEIIPYERLWEMIMENLKR